MSEAPSWHELMADPEADWEPEYTSVRVEDGEIYLIFRTLDDLEIKQLTGTEAEDLREALYYALRARSSNENREFPVTREDEDDE